MVFAQDTEIALQAAVVLANSALGPDTLQRPEDLNDLWAHFDYTGRRDCDEEELAAVRTMRPRLRSLLTSERDAAVELVNAMLAKANATLQMVRHEPLDWHIHAVPPDAPLATRIAVETAMAMIDVIRADEMSRLGICADKDCDGVALDLSRNRSRRYCSTACGNRNAVAAYRARQR